MTHFFCLPFVLVLLVMRRHCRVHGSGSLSMCVCLSFVGQSARDWRTQWDVNNHNKYDGDGPNCVLREQIKGACPCCQCLAHPALVTQQTGTLKHTHTHTSTPADQNGGTEGDSVLWFRPNQLRPDRIKTKTRLRLLVTQKNNKTAFLIPDCF